MSKVKPYVLSILLALGVGGLSAFLTRSNMDLYETIVRPPFSPPAILFPIVWSILYVLMGIGAARIFTAAEPAAGKKENALFVYGVSLFLNFTWSLIFFNTRMFGFAFLWLLLLWISILKTIFDYQKIDPPAAYLQIPYLIWVTFAGYLNAAIWFLNR